MHILVIPSEPFIPPRAPLLGIFQADQSMALHEKGVRVGIIAPSPQSLRLLRKKVPNSADKVFPFPTYVYTGWDIFPKLPYLASRMFIYKGMSLFSNYIDKHGAPNLIHAHNALYAGFLAHEIKCKYGINYIITEHSSVYGRGLLTPRMDEIVKTSLRDCSEFITVSPNLGEIVKQRYPKYIKEYSWIPNILDGIFEQKEPKFTKNVDDKFTFINVASCDDNKNQALIINAFAQSKILSSYARLKIIGNGPLLENLKALALELGIASRVSFLGELSRKEVKTEMENANAFILSSCHETFGVVLIEALATGIPVISTKCGGPECIIDKTNGLLVKNNCINSLLKGMEYMYDNFSLYNPNKLRKDCIKKYGKDAVVKKLLATYEKHKKTNG